MLIPLYGRIAIRPRIEMWEKRYINDRKNIPLSHFVTALPEGEPKSSKKASPFRRGGCEADGEVCFFISFK